MYVVTKVIRYRRLESGIVKEYLDDNGDWQKCDEGQSYPGISLVFHEYNNPFDHDMI
jgi:hypothetical protein